MGSDHCPGQGATHAKKDPGLTKTPKRKGHAKYCNLFHAFISGVVIENRSSDPWIIAVAVDGRPQALPARRAAIDLNRHPRDQCAMAITRLGSRSAGLASEGARKLFKKAMIAWRSTDDRDSYA